MKKAGLILLGIVVGLVIYAQLQLKEVVDQLAMAETKAEKSPVMLLQKALYQEESEDNLDTTIELYEQILGQSPNVKAVAARAAYQLGMCHLKKGKHDKAVKYFQQVIHQYPKQVSATMKAQNQLNTIAPQMSNIARTPLL